MAFTVALHDSGANTTGPTIGGTVDTNSVVFTSGRLYVLFVGFTGASADPTAVAIPSGSGTWTKRVDHLTSSFGGCAVFTSDDASGTSVLRATNGGAGNASGWGWILKEITGQGAGGTLGDGLEAAIAATGTSTAPLADVGTPLADSLLLGFCFVSTTAAFTAGTDYTVLGDVTHTTPATRYAGEYDLAGNTDGVTDGTLASSVEWVMTGVEVKIAAVAGVAPASPHTVHNLSGVEMYPGRQIKYAAEA